MPSHPLKPGKAKASHRAWHGQRPGKHPGRFSGIKSARSPEGTNATSYEFNSDRSTDGINPVQELTGSTPKANLLTGLGVDETFSRTDASGARHLLTDALGSTLALTDGTGAVQTRYSYEPYGKTTVSGTASSNSFEYTGRENDNTGLYFYRARYYNPGLQRFVSEDPIGLAGGPNVYAYVEGNPISNTDPLGLWSITFGGYAGVGGQVTFGSDNGNGFMTARVGLGAGGGFSYNPAGGIPGDAPSDRSQGCVVLACTAKANFNAGPAQAGLEFGGARNYNNGTSALVTSPSGSGRFSNGWLGGGSSFGANTNASVGGQITIYGGRR